MSIVVEWNDIAEMEDTKLDEEVDVYKYISNPDTEAVS